MEQYDYLEQVTSDVKDYVNWEIDTHDYEDREELADDLRDRLFNNDSVTGNASGSYYCNAWKAEEALCHNLDLMVEAYEEFGGMPSMDDFSAEEADVAIRCYLLPQAIEAALDELEDEGKLVFGEEDDEDDDEDEDEDTPNEEDC